MFRVVRINNEEYSTILVLKELEYPYECDGCIFLSANGNECLCSTDDHTMYNKLFNLMSELIDKYSINSCVSPCDVFYELNHTPNNSYIVIEMYDKNNNLSIYLSRYLYKSINYGKNNWI